MKWPKEELRRMAETDDLHISPFREDGETYGTPTWIWSGAQTRVLSGTRLCGGGVVMTARVSGIFGLREQCQSGSKPK